MNKNGVIVIMVAHWFCKSEDLDRNQVIPLTNKKERTNEKLILKLNCICFNRHIISNIYDSSIT